MAKKKNGPDFVAKNKKALHDYFIVEKLEAGIALLGTEVKAVRMGKVNLKDSHARIKNGEVYVHNMHIGSYPFAYTGNHDKLRPRKLLLHRREIKKLSRKVDEKGATLVPLTVYFKNGRVKLQLALAKGKRQYDKRDTIRRRDEQREMEREHKYLSKKV